MNETLAPQAVRAQHCITDSREGRRDRVRAPRDLPLAAIAVKIADVVEPVNGCWVSITRRCGWSATTRVGCALPPPPTGIGGEMDGLR